MKTKDCLCILQCGWSTEEEHRLYRKALKKLRKRAKELHLKYQLNLLKGER